MKLVASSKDELLQSLSEIEIRVPPRHEGRTKAHVERWCICKLLATLAKNDCIYFPITVLKSERPDFVTQQEKLEIGYEVTEAVNADYLRAISLREVGSSSIVDVSLFKWGSKAKSLKTIRDIVSKTTLTGTPWGGNAVEREYGQIVMDVVNKKTERLRSKGFQVLNKNILVIYCNQPLPVLNVLESAEITHCLLSNYWCKSLCFDSVYVEKENNIVEYSKQGYKIFEIHDVW